MLYRKGPIPKTMSYKSVSDDIRRRTVEAVDRELNALGAEWSASIDDEELSHFQCLAQMRERLRLLRISGTLMGIFLTPNKIEFDRLRHFSIIESEAARIARETNAPVEEVEEAMMVLMDEFI
jgi:hypothetical protein